MNVELTDLEILGLQIIALIRNGDLELFKCSTCQAQKERNCDMLEDFDEPVYAHPLIDGELYVCPMRMIPTSIYSWLDEYTYYEKSQWNTAPSYKDINPRFWEATKFYEQFKYELSEFNKKDKPKDDKDNLSKMAGLFNKGDK